jgi:hypothetical protein
MSVAAPNLSRVRRTNEVPTANIVYTPEAIAALLDERLNCWQWAAFASVVFQRMAAVEEWRLDLVLGSPAPPSRRLHSGRAVAQFVTRHVRAADDLVKDVGSCMAAPSFMGVFGDADDDRTADAEGIVRVAHELMDFYDRFLELAEECRRCSVPDQYASLLRDCTHFMTVPLRDFGHFINDVLERFEEMRLRVAAGQVDVQLDPVLLRTTTDDRLIWSILDRLQEL